MANRRTLKKDIHAAASILWLDTFNYFGAQENFDFDKFELINNKLQKAEIESIKRICNPEPMDSAKKVKNYYKTIINDFSNQLTEVLEIIVS